MLADITDRSSWWSNSTATPANGDPISSPELRDSALTTQCSHVSSLVHGLSNKRLGISSSSGHLTIAVVESHLCAPSILGIMAAQLGKDYPLLHPGPHVNVLLLYIFRQCMSPVSVLLQIRYRGVGS